MLSKVPIKEICEDKHTELKLYNKGELNETLAKIIETNVRTPKAIFGDLGAQVASGKTGAERLNAMCDRYGIDEIELLSNEIISRSETSTFAS